MRREALVQQGLDMVLFPPKLICYKSTCGIVASQYLLLQSRQSAGSIRRCQMFYLFIYFLGFGDAAGGTRWIYITGGHCFFFFKGLIFDIILVNE